MSILHLEACIKSKKMHYLIALSFMVSGLSLLKTGTSGHANADNQNDPGVLRAAAEKGDMETAYQLYQDTIPLIRDAVGLKETLDDFDFFIKRGWMVAESKEAIQFATREYREQQAKRSK